MRTSPRRENLRAGSSRRVPFTDLEEVNIQLGKCQGDVTAWQAAYGTQDFARVPTEKMARSIRIGRLGWDQTSTMARDRPCPCAGYQMNGYVLEGAAIAARRGKTVNESMR